MSEQNTSAVLDSAHIGDIKGAFGTLKLNGGDEGPSSWGTRIKTLLAIVGPGLIVMVGDNDAGAFSTYSQAGQNYGTSLLWTLLLLVPVLYVNQEMVLRLGVVTGVGHARLILERFGRFWGAFSAIDLFILNALTIITEFIGISLGLGYLGVPKLIGVPIAAAVIIAAASTGSFQRFERVCMILVFGSLLLVPIFLMTPEHWAGIGHDFVVPGFPPGAELSTVMLLIIGIVGTTVAPWQLFFQQSYVIDKRITPKYMAYEKADLWIGITIVIVGAAAMMSFASGAFTGHAEFGNFTDAAAVAAGLGHYVSHLTGVLFAIALVDASIIGAAAVGLSTSYALGDVLGLKHSLHRKPSEAKGFYATFVGILALAAVVVLIPGAPLGLITEGVQTLAGVLLPSATVFLLLLCNDREVLGPWINGKKLNLFTTFVVGVLVLMSIVLTTAVLFPSISSAAILAILVGGAIAGCLGGGAFMLFNRRSGAKTPIDRTGQSNWRMPPLTLLARPQLSKGTKMGMGVLRSYLLIAMILVIVRIVELAVH